MGHNSSYLDGNRIGQPSPKAGYINSNYGIVGSNRKPLRQLSLGARLLTPCNKNGNLETSSSTYKDIQERRNSTIWNAIAHSDYKSFVKEEETKRIRQREQQENIKNFLDKQVKEQQFKKTVQEKCHASDYTQMLEELKKYDEKAAQRMRQKKRELAEQVKTNFDQTRLKIGKKILDKTQDIILENYYQTSFQKTSKVLDNHHNYDIKKLREERQKEFERDMFEQQNLKNSSKVLTKLDHIVNMDVEFDLMNKNQDRYKQKIKELVERNDMIYNNIQNSPYKNLAVAEREREDKLKLRANQSFVEETQKRNVEFEGLQLKKHKQYMDLKTVQK